MRKLTVGNKANFTIFVVIIIVIIGILILALGQGLSVDKQLYTVEPQTFLYDFEYTPIKLEETAQLQAKWDGNYYLKTEQNEQYKLGKYAIAYQTIYGQLDLYGKMYQIQPNGEVIKLAGNNKLTDFSQDGIYKLADRQYLITSNRIVNDTGKLNTEKYLIIILDKAGNTLLLNHELNAKTINPMIIKTSSFELDVANEQVIYNDMTIDLKKIIGSTNEYQEKENVILNEETAGVEPEKVASPGTTQTENNNNNQQTTQINGNIVNQTEETGLEEETKKELAKSISLRTVTASSSSITIQYNIQDPERRYQVVYLEIDGDIQKTIALDKNATTYTVTGLTPSTNYKVTLASKEVNVDGDVVQNVDDIVNIRTEKMDTSLKITKVTTNKIYYHLKLDANYLFDSAKISLYIDGEKQKTEKLDVTSATKETGYTGSFDYQYGNEVIIQLEDVKYNGKTIMVDCTAKFKNY